MKFWICLLLATGVLGGENFPHFYNLPKSFAKVAASLEPPFSGVGIDDLLLPIVDRYSDFLSHGPGARISEHLMSDEKNGSSRCSRDLLYLSQNLHSEDMWGWKMLDAFGKPGNGILEGNLKWIGNYHECTGVYVPLNATAGGFHAQYCNLDLTVAALQKTIPLTVGICIPESCSSVPLDRFQGAFSALSGTSSHVNVTKKTCQPVSKKLTSSAISMIVLISVFVMLAAIGSSISAFEYFSKGERPEGGCRHAQAEVESQLDSSSTALLPDENEKSRLHQVKEFLQCFCVFSNGGKVLDTTQGTEGQLLCLHGIRFLSMAWVILGHTYLATIVSVGNLIEAIGFVDKWLFQIILNGFYSVDSFFLLSGFLMAHLYFQQAAKTKGKIPWLYFYIHRFVRLTPVYMVVLGFQTALSYYMGSGPFWTLDEVDTVCQENWWYNLLYINNFIPQAKQCVAWTWYLANDMQFFIVSPLILIALWRWPPVGYSVLGIFLSATVAANFGIVYQYGLHSGYGTVAATSVNLQDLTVEQATFFQEVYIKPYTRMSPYLVGIFLAYYMFRRKHSNQGKLHWITLSVGWILASVASLFCVFCLYHSILTLVESGFYNAFGHAGFTAGVGWVIFTCLNGQAGPIDRILSFKLFIPLSRLTYCAYLIHPIVVNAYFGSLEVTLQFTHKTMVTLYLGLLVVTYALAFVVSVLFESPIIRLDKLIRKKFTS